MADKEHDLELCFMKSSLSPVNHGCIRGKRIAFVLLLAFLLMPAVCEGRTQQAEKVLAYLKGLGNGRYMFGQMANKELKATR